MIIMKTISKSFARLFDGLLLYIKICYLLYFKSTLNVMLLFFQGMNSNKLQ